MRIISWFAMVCFPPIISYSVCVGVWVRSNCFVHAAVRIIPGHEKWPTQGRPSPCRSDIRSAKQKQFSRPMTGHTPRKLPPFGRNLPHHRSTRIVSLHTLDYDTTYSPFCQEQFQIFSQIFLWNFVHSDGVKKVHKMNGAVLPPLLLLLFFCFLLNPLPGRHFLVNRFLSGRCKHLFLDGIQFSLRFLDDHQQIHRHHCDTGQPHHKKGVE